MLDERVPPFLLHSLVGALVLYWVLAVVRCGEDECVDRPVVAGIVSAFWLAGAAIVISAQVIHNTTSVVIGVIALALLLQNRKKITEPALVAAAAITGLLQRAGAAMFQASLETCSGDASTKPLM